MTSRTGASRVSAVPLFIVLTTGCTTPATMPGAPTGVNPLDIPVTPRRLAFPSGLALLRVWGHTWLTNGPVCEPVLGTREGSSVGAIVQVTADDTGWIVRTDQSGGLELHVSQAGRSIVEGEVLTGTAHGVMRDAFAVAPDLPRNLSVNLSPDGPAAIDGWGTTALPYFQGTMTGAIRYTDSSGGSVTCPVVYWSLSPAGPLPSRQALRLGLGRESKPDSARLPLARTFQEVFRSPRVGERRNPKGET